MFIPFLSNNVEVVEKDNVFEISGNFGLGFRRFCSNLLGNEVRLKSLFKDITLTKLSFYSFFLPEVLSLFKTIIEDDGSIKFKVNVVTARNVVEELTKKIENTRVSELNLKLVEDNMSFKILPHQEEIFKRFEQLVKYNGYRGILVDADPGTGKTFSSLALAEALNSEVVIIICPNSTVSDPWIKSISEKGSGCVFKTPRDSFVIREGKEYQGEKYLIVHYEGLEKLLDYISVLKNKRSTVIIDESHNLANSISKRTSLAVEIINAIKARYVFPMSGTPLKSSYKELGVIFKFLDTRFDNVVENRYYKLYKSCNSWLSVQLTERYLGYSVKIKKSSIALEDPKTIDLKIKLDNGDEYTLDTIKTKLKTFVEERKKELDEKSDYYYRMYLDLYNLAIERSNGAFTENEIFKYQNSFNRICKASPGELMMMSDRLKEVNDFEKRLSFYLKGEEKKNFQEAKTIVKYPMLKIQGEALGKIITGARIACVNDLAKKINYKNVVDSTLKKTLIFSSYISSCKECQRKLDLEGYSSIGVYGETTKHLDRNVNEFTNNPKLNPMVTTYSSLSTGVPLTAANVVIFLDLPYRLHTYTQALSRVWRLGQDQQVYLYIVSLDTGETPNINTRTVDIIKFFKTEIEKITGYSTGIELDSDVTISQEAYSLLKRYEWYPLPKKNTGKKLKIFETWI